ncbi:AFR100Wp [Eremothecium gossypii ATCC 10895]|uniref:Exocyst complex protein EXO70 n=1 Tax=Eremothecium gossypii (strain ATCC 10895 / CBS 109.51 / FGSC 9923 / NRRL Y-1056) TaxID=284811 RepID=EXO70_EREGS|nr:AFR100Wp [Eremothecium gossypii ATCC 10895]Q754H0.1 RecName: Full=Exocyst complex protein EXO70 [Eremothecium gossypii ATCC 10895]AAS53471.1 AFR100Wp [Eremothecium gossypii ATCC 10895]AEY97783.1 FAFR100Wp [Eremothecium gossypii FDAG1]
MPSIDVDEADILILSDGLKQVNELTREITGSLSKITSTTSKSSKLFAPIIETNTRLNVLKRNIESSFDSVSSIKDLASDASKYEIILEQEITQVGLRKFIKTLHKVDDIMDDLREKSKSTADFRGIVTHLEELTMIGEKNLQIYFANKLNQIQPFDPQVYMNKKQNFPYYYDEDLNDIAAILDYFGDTEQNPVTEIFMKQQGQLVLNSLAFLEPFTKQITSESNVPYQRGSSGFNSYTEAFITFVSGVSVLIDDVFVKLPDRRPAVFCKIVAPILHNYTKILRYNIDLVKDDINNYGLFSFELSENINRVHQLFKGKPLQNNEQLLECEAELKSISESLFKDLIQYIGQKTASLAQLPTDNGVTEATVDVMSRLRKFSEYKSGCLATIQSMTRESWLPNESKNVWTISMTPKNAQQLLSCFFSDAIDYLTISLERKAQKILNPNLEPEVGAPHKRIPQMQRIGFFVLTNITLIEQIVQRSEINTVLEDIGAARLVKLNARYVNYFASDWRDLASNLLDQVFVDSSGKISSKDKDQVKEKFRKFNEGFEQLVSNYKTCRITDPAMKKLLKQEIFALVAPMYERFHNRYKDSFKNPRKHIKYTPNELMNILNSLGR